MNQIDSLLSINYFELLSALVIIMVASVFIKEAVERFCNMVGIEFAWVKARKQRAECEKTIQQDLDNLAIRQKHLEQIREMDINKSRDFEEKVVNAISSIRKDIKALAEDIERREAERRFKKVRYDILNFANKIYTMDKISDELLSQIFDEVQEYESLVTDFGFSNNRVNASIKVINQKYQELLEKGRIIKED